MLLRMFFNISIVEKVISNLNIWSLVLNSSSKLANIECGELDH